MRATHFLTKALPRVAAEMALHVLAYNLMRVMNIMGVQPLIGDEGIVVADMPSSAAAEPPKTAGISTRSTSRRKETPNPEDDRARSPRPKSQRMCFRQGVFTRPRPVPDID